MCSIQNGTTPSRREIRNDAIVIGGCLRLGGRRFVGLDDGEPVEVPVTQHELAGAANLSRNSAGTMVQRLKARGLIDLGYRGMTIRAPGALRAFVDEG